MSLLHTLLDYLTHRWIELEERGLVLLKLVDTGGNNVRYVHLRSFSSNVDVVEALKRWGPHQIELGNNLKYLGISFGNRSLFNQI